VPKKIEMPADEKAKLLFDVVEDRKAVDPVLIDLRGKTLLTDFFIVCSGTSNVHIRAIADRILEKADEVRLPTPRVEGESVAEWVLIDFGDVVIHVMAEEPRERYKLEQFWTTPQPKGALPPTPDSISQDAEEDDVDVEDLNFDDDDEDIDDDDLDDAAFFEDADREVEPIDEEDEAEASEASDDTKPSSHKNGSAH
jgi:ribosome-associated protein